MRRIVIVIFAFCVMALQFERVYAQDNLLVNPGFEPPYSDSYQREVANGWTPWAAAGNPEWFDEAYSLKYSGATSQGIMSRWEVFVGGLYQQVSGLTPGTVVRAQVFGTIYVAGSDDFAVARSRIRIGLDPSGGTNPGAGGIAWSGEINSSLAQQTGETAYTVPYTPLTAETTLTGSSVTLFLWGTQDYPAEEHRQLWDQASLVVLGQTDNSIAPTPTGGEPSGAASPVPAIPDGVQAQAPRPDGSIVHVVESGQTLTGIAIAYGVPLEQIARMNSLADISLLRVGQELVIRPAPGSQEELRLTVPPTVPAPTTAPIQPTAIAQVFPTTGPGTPTLFPTPTNTATALPTAPVATAEVNPDAALAGTSAVCVGLFDDSNQNRIRDTGEPFLNGGILALRRGTEEISRISSDGLSDFHCFTDLEPGEYLAVAAAPDGYGLTTPDQFRLRPQSGDQLTVTFGAAAGYVPANAPISNVDPLNEVVMDANGNAEDKPIKQVLQYLGIIVLGLAGLVLVGGGTTALLLRRK